MPISAHIIADSINPAGVRLTSVILTCPKFINAEINTHRMLSKSTSSSRAIPSKKMLEAVGSDPVLPTTWPRNEPGMQSSSELNSDEVTQCTDYIIDHANLTVDMCSNLADIGLHKQNANRYLEPWSWMTMLVTGTDWDNFFALRVHKMAQPEFQRVAYVFAKEYLASTPKELNVGEWHIPFDHHGIEILTPHERLKASIGRCARVSYKNQDGNYSPEDDIKLYDRLISQWPKHMGPFEHVACARHDDKYSAMTGQLINDQIYGGRSCRWTTSNFRGWTQYRKLMRDENVTKLDLAKHVADYQKEMGIL